MLHYYGLWKKKTPEMLDLNYTLPSNLPNKDNILLDQLIYDKVKKFCFPYEVTVTLKLKQLAVSSY